MSAAQANLALNVRRSHDLQVDYGRRKIQCRLTQTIEEQLTNLSNERKREGEVEG